jgi:hypothetical protein
LLHYLDPSTLLLLLLLLLLLSRCCCDCHRSLICWLQLYYL